MKPPKMILMTHEMQHVLGLYREKKHRVFFFFEVNLGRLVEFFFVGIYFPMARKWKGTQVGHHGSQDRECSMAVIFATWDCST